MEIWTNCTPEAFAKFNHMDTADLERYMAKISSSHTNTAYRVLQSWCSGEKKASTKIGKADVSFRRQEERLIIRMSRKNHFLEYHSKGPSLSYMEWNAKTMIGLFILEANLNSPPITSEGILRHFQNFTVETSANWDTLEQREKDGVLKLTHVICEGNRITSIRFRLREDILRIEIKEHPKEKLEEMLASCRINGFHPTVWFCDESDKK